MWRHVESATIRKRSDGLGMATLFDVSLRVKRIIEHRSTAPRSLSVTADLWKREQRKKEDEKIYNKRAERVDGSRASTLSCPRSSVNANKLLYSTLQEADPIKW